jgi:hypothetical protein
MSHKYQSLPILKAKKHSFKISVSFRSAKGIHSQHAQHGKKSSCSQASGLSMSELKMKKKDLEKCKVCSELFSADEMVLHKNIHTGIKQK